MLCELGTREIKNSTTWKWHRYTDDGNLTEIIQFPKKKKIVGESSNKKLKVRISYQNIQAVFVYEMRSMFGAVILFESN
jgi:hypothetical protein